MIPNDRRDVFNLNVQKEADKMRIKRKQETSTE